MESWKRLIHNDILDFLPILALIYHSVHSTHLSQIPTKVAVTLDFWNKLKPSIGSLYSFESRNCSLMVGYKDGCVN